MIYIFIFTLSTFTTILLFREIARNKGFNAESYYKKYLLEEIPIGIYIKDTKGNIVFSNNTFKQISGLKNKNKTNIYNIYPENIIANIQNEDKELILKNKIFRNEIQLNFNKEDPHYYKITKKPIFNKKNKVYGFIILLEKIDTEKEIEATKETFIANLAHDLKSPTFAQINTLSLLSQGTFGKLSSEQKEMIELTKQSCKYLADLISTILDTYRLHNGKISLQLEEINLSDVITFICKDFEKLATEKHQTIQFIKTQDCFINADKLQIKRVISNILSNAIQYGFAQTNIIVNLEISNSIIEFSVTNKSKPISNKELSTIFDEFNKTSMSHFNNASTGLGLHLTKQIIEMHNGKMFACSSEDGTCTFGFKLKVADKNNITIAK